jgi:hypothetical protein
MSVLHYEHEGSLPKLLAYICLCKLLTCNQKIPLSKAFIGEQSKIKSSIFAITQKISQENRRRIDQLFFKNFTVIIFFPKISPQYI